MRQFRLRLREPAGCPVLPAVRPTDARAAADGGVSRVGLVIELVVELGGGALSAFSPDVPPIPRPMPSVVLARSVPAALRRTPSVAKIWGVLRLFVRGTATAGYWPCRALQVRARHTLVMHARQCELAADLLSHHVPADDAAVLADAAKNVDVSHREIALSVVLMYASFGLLCYWLYEHDWAYAAIHRWWFDGPSAGDTLAWWAVGLLCAAFLVMIVQINRQVVALQQFVLAFNAVCDDRVPAIEPPKLVWGGSPVHLIAGGAMAYFGLVWAVPMMLAWAAFGTFARTQARGVRVQLAERLTAITGIEPVVPTADVCANIDCRHGLPIDADFCPRCGTAV